MKKQRIATDAAERSTFQPFAGLEIGGLPDGPEISHPAAPAKKGRVVLSRETAHRCGKTVVIIEGFEPQIKDAEIDEMARALRKNCGVGGTLHNRRIELQGEVAPRVRSWLESAGFRVAGV